MKTMAQPGLLEAQVVAPAVAVTRPTPQSSTPQPSTAPPMAPPATSEEAGLIAAFVKGSIVGFVAVFVLLGGMTLAAGMGIAAALEVGAFTAFWGGPGFGGMMGAVLHHSRTEGT
jgi:hypothetical protein